MINLRYHPITAFALTYVPLLFLVAYLGLLAATVSPDDISEGAIRAVKSVMNLVPIAIVWWATVRAVRGNGAPLFHFTSYDPDKARAGFRKHLWLWAVVFGLAAAATDLGAVVGVSWAMDVPRSPYSFLRLILVAAVYAFVAREAIKANLGPPAAPVAQRASDDVPRTGLAGESAEPQPPLTRQDMSTR